jgi:superfamily I DNA and/or RNA helicase
MKSTPPFFLIAVVALLLVSCSVRRPTAGNYYSHGSAAYINSLKLNSNGSFLLSLDNFQRKTGYLGSWKYLSKDTLLLTYDIEDFPRIIKSEHISKKEQKIVLLNSNEVKYDDFVLSKLKLDQSIATNKVK